MKVLRTTLIFALYLEALLSLATEPSVLLAQSSQPVLVETKRIWDKAKHNAFTDLVRFQERWYCVFREGQGHVSADGSLRVLVSENGDKWESAALISSPTSDLRDAKISVTPAGQLMLAGAEAIPHPETGKTYKHQSLIWFSDDGKYWSKKHSVADPNFWLWRVTWHNNRAYGFGYATNEEAKRIRFYTSDDGKTFETLADNAAAELGFVNESSLAFLPDNTCYCLLRRDGKKNTGLLGTAQPPYTQWSWKDLDVRFGGPKMLQLPDGRFLAVVRLYDEKVRTSLCWIDVKNGRLAESLELPSGGDTSYAGMVWHNDLLWISYYSSHEGKTSIYLSKVRFE